MNETSDGIMLVLNERSFLTVSTKILIDLATEYTNIQSPLAPKCIQIFSRHRERPVSPQSYRLTDLFDSHSKIRLRQETHIFVVHCCLDFYCVDIFCICVTLASCVRQMSYACLRVSVSSFCSNFL